MRLRPWFTHTIIACIGMVLAVAGDRYHRQAADVRQLAKASQCWCGGSCNPCRCDGRQCVTERSAPSAAPKAAPKSAAAGPSIVFPQTVQVAKPGLFTIIPTSVDADAVAYTAIDDGAQLIPSNLLKDSTIACGIALQNGFYRVRAVAAKTVNGQAVLSPFYEITVVVGAPGPSPQPPPPPPAPGPPTPTDPFFSVLNAAWQAETAADKAASVSQLIALYQQAATVANDPAMQTNNDVFAKVHKAAVVLLGDAPSGKLIGVRTAIAQNLSATFPNASDPLTTMSRQLLATNFTRIANDLAALK